MTHFRTIILGAAAAALSLSACASAPESSSPPESLAYAEQPVRPSTTLIDHVPEVEMTDEQDAMTTFEAALICDRGNKSFDSAAAIEEARDALLADHGLTVAEYLGFRGELEADRGLRDMVIYKYQEGCT